METPRQTRTPEPTAPGVVQVRSEQTREIFADSAVLHLEVGGERFFFGDEALEKAAELRKLVGELVDLGLGTEAIRIKNVQAEARAGVFGRSSKVVYALAVHLDNLALLPEALGTVTGQKTLELKGLEWRFGGENEAREAMVAECTEGALRKARIMAAAAGCETRGVKLLSERAENLKEPDSVPFGEAPEMLGIRRRRASLELGTTLSGSKVLRVVVEAELWV